MKETQVKINAKVIDSKARDQIDLMQKSPAFHGLISIMPDVHPGMGSVIGFTGKFNDVVIPGVVGVDIGCGVTAYPLGDIEIDYEKLDTHIRKVVPLGFNSQKDDRYLKNIEPHFKRIALDLCDKITTKFLIPNCRKKYIDPILQLGTLGGGNHFIEIGEYMNEKWLIVHSGSRNLGQKVAMHFQGRAKKFCRDSKISVAQNLEYLPLEYGGNDYITNMHLTQTYAHLNREIMLQMILSFFPTLRYDHRLCINSTHNYISSMDGIVRKGAISAHKGEQVIIPLNMSAGTIIGRGKGNSSYNNSAPHGAGRLGSRAEMGRKLKDGEITMAEFDTTMEGIYSTCVDKSRIDESPMAYKSLEDIKEYLEETVEILSILKPVYNLKA